MVQVTIDLESELEHKIRGLSKQSGISISKFISTFLESNLSKKWTNETKALSGTWEDFPTLEEIRGVAKDTNREVL